MDWRKARENARNDDTTVSVDTVEGSLLSWAASAAVVVFAFVALGSYLGNHSSFRWVQDAGVLLGLAAGVAAAIAAQMTVGLHKVGLAALAVAVAVAILRAVVK